MNKSNTKTEALVIAISALVVLAVAGLIVAVSYIVTMPANLLVF